jgi:hypothetical protein
MNSAVWISINWGMVRPIAWAVLRLMTKSNVVGGYWRVEAAE